MLGPLRSFALCLLLASSADTTAARGAPEALGDLPGGETSSEAFRFSADGRVIVGRSTSAYGPEAFRWEGGKMQGLGDLPGGDFVSEASAASADGAVVVGQGTGVNGPEAFRWEGGVMRDSAICRADALRARRTASRPMAA